MDNYDAHVVVDSQTPEEQPAVEEVSDGVFVFRIGEKERERYRAEQRLKLNDDTIDWGHFHSMGEYELEALPLTMLKRYAKQLNKNHGMERARAEQKKEKFGKSTPQSFKWAHRIAVVDRVICKVKDAEFRKQAQEGLDL